jgi:alkanesulfonate monooxygenase SsuD/methylene tetrahydromethanopterin reductase-like flavin-dependent oxidoreductase (luciferase family)
VGRVSKRGEVMATRPRMEFGYNPPTGDRNMELIRPREYLSDLHGALDVASQGFGSIWISDHLNYTDEYRIECWTLLTWIAARYPGVDLGTIVMSNSFRSPSLMAKMGASLQEISLGRFILGYGAGWYEPEYTAYGYDFQRFRTRLEMLEEGVQVIKTLWTEAPASFSGKHYRVHEAYCAPLPDPPPPIMLGGAGEKYTLGVVARQADWWNDLARPMDEARHKMDVLRQRCDEEGRDFGSIRKTVTARVFIDRSHSKATQMAEGWIDNVQPPVFGDPSAVRDHFEEIIDIGFDLCIVVLPKFQELDDMKLFMDEVVPHFA